jgi:2-polyprenyl-3-methyl-5-hydroxy-6-metoxy-1,4-benzoquinol methylase
MDLVKIVKDYYDTDASAEWERLQRHRFEFELTVRYINKYVKPGDKVLDIGGGPGRYSLYLAEKGCEVTLFDLSCANIEFAEARASEQGISLRTMIGDAREIDRMVSGKFDQILLMGPLYHLQEEPDRIKVIKASLSLLKPNGTMFISFISSYAGIIYSMKYEPQLILNSDVEYQYKLFEDDLPFSGESFTQAYFIRHKDVLPFMDRFPLEKLHFFGQESILSPCEENIKSQPREVMDKWLELAEKVCERRDLLSYSEHLMYIGRKIG